MKKIEGKGGTRGENTWKKGEQVCWRGGEYLGHPPYNLSKRIEANEGDTPGSHVNI